MQHDKAGHSAEYWEAFRRTKRRGSPRATVFADGKDKMERRGNRNQQTQQEVEEALSIHEEFDEEFWREHLHDGGPG